MRQLLFHTTGMPSGLNMYRFALDPDSYGG